MYMQTQICYATHALLLYLFINFIEYFTVIYYLFKRKEYKCYLMIVAA